MERKNRELPLAECRLPTLAGRQVVAGAACKSNHIPDIRQCMRTIYEQTGGSAALQVTWSPCGSLAPTVAHVPSKLGAVPGTQPGTGFKQ